MADEAAPPPVETPRSPGEAARAAGMAGIGSLLNAGVGTLQTAVGVGIGVAAAQALTPEATRIRQATYSLDPSLALEPDAAARIVSQSIRAQTWGAGEAANSGVGGDRFDSLVQAELQVPPVGELVTLLRRGKLTDAELAHAIEKLAYEPGWSDLVARLAPVALEPAEIAKAIHRGIMAGDGLLVSEPSTVPGNVPIVPPSPLDPKEQARWAGLTAEQLRVLVGNAGLPPGVMEGLALLNRGKITEDDFSRLVAESNMRNEWTDVLLALRRQLLTVREYAEADLRGVLSHGDAKDGAALHGLESDDYETLFATVGRPLSVHAITTALARGGTFGGTYADVPEPYRDATRRSNTRPEYARLAYANRYTYPSAFVIRSLAQTGELSHDDTLQTLLEIGWKPEFAHKIASAWSGSGTAATDTHVAKAQTQLWTAAHKSYLNGLTTDPEATVDLTAAGVTADAILAVLALWAQEREIVRRSLSATQIKKAIGQPGLDTAWATARLVQLGYSPGDAATFLAE